MNPFICTYEVLVPVKKNQKQLIGFSSNISLCEAYTSLHTEPLQMVVVPSNHLFHHVSSASKPYRIGSHHGVKGSLVVILMTQETRDKAFREISLSIPMLCGSSCEKILVNCCCSRQNIIETINHGPCMAMAGPTTESVTRRSTAHIYIGTYRHPSNDPAVCSVRDFRRHPRWIVVDEMRDGCNRTLFLQEGIYFVLVLHT